MSDAIEPGDTITVSTVGGQRRATFHGLVMGIEESARVRWVNNGKLATVDTARIREWPRPELERRRGPAPTFSGPTEPAAPPRAPRPPRARAVLTAVPKPAKPTRSGQYLAFVRAEPCASCRAPGPSDPHHWGPRGMGQKTDDHRTVPLCRRCHDHFHDQGSLPAMDVATTKVLLLQRQLDLLIRWIQRLEQGG